VRLFFVKDKGYAIRPDNCCTSIMQVITPGRGVVHALHAFTRRKYAKEFIEHRKMFNKDTDLEIVALDCQVRTW
jgi:hypothetical protein